MESINSYGSPNFGRIITGSGLKGKLCDKKCPKNFVFGFVSLRLKCRKASISRANNVDVLLDYNDFDGYYASVLPKGKKKLSEKVQNPSFKNISNTDKCINELKNWVDYWNNQFSGKR